MTVTDLFVYPVKSLAGIRVDAAAVTARGFEHDRRWMIVGPDGTFVSQRSTPALARIRTAIVEDSIRIASDDASVQIPRRPEQVGTRGKVTIWGDEVHAVPAAPRASDWLSELVGESVELVWMPDDADRSPDAAHSRGDDRVSFADGYPILLTGTESLAELNRNLPEPEPEPVPMSRFRPNIVVRTAIPWEEEAWRLVSTADVRDDGVKLEVVNPCFRCVVTTVPQHPAAGETTVLASGRPASAGADRSEPLRTLARIHRIGGKAAFGVNLIPRSAGTIRAGDDLAVRMSVMGA